MSQLLARASFLDVLRGRSPLIGARCSDQSPRGFISPLEPRMRMGISYGDAALEEAEALQRRTLKKDLALLLRAVLVALLSPRMAGRHEGRPFIVSARVDALSVPEAVEQVLRPAPDGRVVHFAHPHALNLAAFDRELSANLARADLVLPDGIGLRVAAAMVGVQLRDNLNGTDLLPLLCRGAAERGLPLALVGGKPGVAEECARRLSALAPGLRFAVVSDGFLDDLRSKRVADEIRAKGPVLALVGMGTPVQERWVRRWLAGGRGVCAVTVGGLFDFYSGNIPRASQAWRELGLEWVWRLIQEPRRMAGRYLLGNPLFVMLAALQRLRGHAEPAREPVAPLQLRAAAEEPAPIRATGG